MKRQTQPTSLHPKTPTAAIIQRVLDSFGPTETGNQALQHIAILWLIYDCSGDEKPITTARLNAMTRVNATTIVRIAERLEKIGLIRRQRIHASHGRGRAWGYHPTLPDDLTGLVIRHLLTHRFPG